MIRAAEVTVAYGRTVAVDRVTCSAEAGSILAVTGASGAGKTSLLWALAGLRPVTSGVVEWAAGTSVQLIPQGNGLVSVLTARENVTVPLLAAGFDVAEAEQRADAALDRLGVKGQSRQQAEQLSGGQRQRVAIARGVAMRSAVLFADEVTSDLDGVNRDLVLEVLRETADAGSAVVFATHDPEAARWCDHELHLVDGRRTPPTPTRRG